MTTLQSSATPRFWKLFAELPEQVQDLAIEKYDLFKKIPTIPPLDFKQKERYGQSTLVELIELLPSGLRITSGGFGLVATRITITSWTV